MIEVARLAVVDEDQESQVVTVGLAENSDGSGEILMLQRQEGEFSRRDQEFGQNTYCLITGDAATYYGGVESYSVQGQKVKLQLSPDASSAR